MPTQARAAARTKSLSVRPVIAVALMIFAAPVCAQVFKCATPGGSIEYRSTPCPATAAQKNVRIADDTPTETDARRARINAERAKSGAARLDAEHERRQQNAMTETSRRHDEKDRKSARCAEYEARAEQLKKRAETWYSKGLKDDDLADAKALNDQHFSECFGSR